MFSEHILYVAHIRVKNYKVTCTSVFHIQQVIILNTTTQFVIRFHDHFWMGNKFITQLSCLSLHWSMINNQTHILHISSTLWVEETCFSRNCFMQRKCVSMGRCRKSDKHPYKDLAKADHKSDMKQIFHFEFLFIARFC